MLTELVLTHPCGQAVIWSAGAYFNRRPQRCRSAADPAPLTHCPTCGEWLGSAFVRAEENSRPVVPHSRGVCARAS